MRKLGIKKRMEVLLNYFMGHSMDVTAKTVDVSKGSIVNIVNELKKGKYPRLDHVVDQVDQLRELAVKLRKSGRGVSEAILGVAMYERLQTIGVEPSTLNHWVRLCKQRLTAAEYPVEKVVKSALEQIKIETKTGKSYAEQLKDFREKRKKIENLKLEIKDLEAKRSSLRSDIETGNKSLVQMRRNLRVEKKKLDKQLEQHLNRHELSMEKVNTVLRIVPEALRKKGLSETETKLLVRQAKELGSLHRAVRKIKEEKTLLENKVIRLRGIEANIKSQVSRTSWWIEERRREAEKLDSEMTFKGNEIQRLLGERDTLMKELSELLETKADVEHIQKEIETLKETEKSLKIEVKRLGKEYSRLREDIDLAKKWVGLIADPKQLDNRALDRFVDEAILLRRRRTGKEVKRVIYNGRLLCECCLSPLSRREPVSEETLRKKMVKLFLPLIEDEFIPKRQYEKEREKRERSYQDIFDKEKELIDKYKKWCEDFLEKNAKLIDQNDKLKSENFKLKQEIASLKVEIIR